MKKMKNSYKKSGVNISLANKFVKHISRLSKKNVKKKKDSFNKDIIGGFGSLFDISKTKIKDPVLVSCTDGVGTKLDLANKYKKFDNTIYIQHFTGWNKKSFNWAAKKFKKKLINNFDRFEKTENDLFLFV